MFTMISCFVLILLLVATAFDFRSRVIPDWIAIVIALLAIVSAAMGWLGITPVWVILGGLLGLVIGFALFQYANLGGGDAKLIVALGALVGPAGLLIVLFGMAIAGGVLSLIAMFRNQRDYAYVPAITAGFVWYLGFVSQI